MVQDCSSKYRHPYTVDSFFIFSILFYFFLFRFPIFEAYDPAGNFDLVILAPRLDFAPDVGKRSFRRSSRALMRRLCSYCCGIFRSLAHFAGLLISISVMLGA